jgi:hypothetical protein
MIQLTVVTPFLKSKIDNKDIYTTLPEGWPEGYKALKSIVRLRKALYGVKKAPQLWHINFNAFPLSLGLIQFLDDPNVYFRSDGILILLYVDNIYMSYLEAAAKAAIEVRAKLTENYNITNLGLARQFLRIEIYSDSTKVSLSLKVYITTILKRFNKEHTYSVLLPIDPDERLDLAEDREEKKLEDITDYQAVVGSQMYAALATRPDILYAVATFSCYNSRPFTSHMTAAKRVLLYLKSTADF